MREIAPPGEYENYVDFMALVHDDHELIDGDISTLEKSLMNKHQRLFWNGQNVRSMHRLADLWRTDLDRDVYFSAMYEAHQKKTVDSQIVKIADILDGIGECAREVSHGNNLFKEPLRNYVDMLQRSEEDYPLGYAAVRKHPFLDQDGFNAFFSYWQSLELTVSRQSTLLPVPRGSAALAPYRPYRKL